ncbi:11801_t:CDS:2, partial [Cetraspora pellucida]
QENIRNTNVNDINDNTQYYEITKSPPRSPLNKSFTNTLENLSVDPKDGKESKTMDLILETTKQILTQNILIMERQEALETMITLLTNGVKNLQSSYKHFKSNMKDHDHEWWQKGMIQGIKNAIDNWLYPNKKIYEQAIRQELEALCPNKMGCTESCKYHGALFESFWHAIFDHKESNEVQWCFENLDSMIKEEDKTYLQMVAKKVFSRQPTKNQYA